MGVKGKEDSQEFKVLWAQPPSTHSSDARMPKAVTRLTCVSLASAAEGEASEPLRAALAFPLATRVPLWARGFKPTRYTDIPPFKNNDRPDRNYAQRRIRVFV